jgi:NitT/TauT family transport system substrate-binding protein
MKLTLGQVFHGLFYAPNYVARALGYFENEGLDVTVRIANPPSSIIDMLFSGQADLVLTGPARLYERSQSESQEALCLGQATSGSFFFLVAKENEQSFNLSQLVGKRLLIFPGTPTPWLCLRHLLNTSGIEPSSVQVLREASPEASIRTFVSGGADFIELPEPFVEQVLDEMGRYRVIPIGPILGRVPFTVYLARRADVDKQPEPFRRFLKAIGRASRWLRSTSAFETAAAVTAMFPQVPVGTIVRSIARYQQQSLWEGVPNLQKNEFDRLYRILTEAAKTPPSLYHDMVYVGSASE